MRPTTDLEFRGYLAFLHYDKEYPWDGRWLFHDFWAQIGIAALLQAVRGIFKETGPSWSREALRDLMHAYWSLGDE